MRILGKLQLSHLIRQGDFKQVKSFGIPLVNDVGESTTFLLLQSCINSLTICADIHYREIISIHKFHFASDWHKNVATKRIDF